MAIKQGFPYQYYTGHTIDHGRVLLLLMPLFIMRIPACLGGRTERFSDQETTSLYY